MEKPSAKLCEAAGVYVICGPRKSGKTTLLKQILFSLPQHEPVCRLGGDSHDLDHLQQCFRAKEIDRLVQRLSQAVMAFQSRTTIVCDEPPFTTGLASVIINARHFNVRFLLTVQQIKDLPLKIRSCVDAWLYPSPSGIVYDSPGHEVQLPSLKHNVSLLSISEKPLYVQQIIHTTELLPEIGTLIGHYLATINQCPACARAL
jgi:hypothetical protein